MLDIIIYADIERPEMTSRTIMTLKENIRMMATATLVGVHRGQIKKRIRDVKKYLRSGSAPEGVRHGADYLHDLEELYDILKWSPGIYEVVPDDGDTLPALYNKAIRLGEYPWIMMVESGVLFRPAWSTMVFNGTQMKPMGSSPLKGFTGKILWNGPGEMISSGISDPDTLPPTYRGYGEPQGTQVHCSVQPVVYMPKELMVVSREEFEKVGGFYEGYKVGYFDIDLCHRLFGKSDSIISGMFYRPDLELYVDYCSIVKAYQVVSAGRGERFQALKEDHERWLTRKKSFLSNEGKSAEEGVVAGDSKE